MTAEVYASIDIKVHVYIRALIAADLLSVVQAKARLRIYFTAILEADWDGPDDDTREAKYRQGHKDVPPF